MHRCQGLRGVGFRLGDLGGGVRFFLLRVFDLGFHPHVVGAGLFQLVFGRGQIIRKLLAVGFFLDQRLRAVGDGLVLARDVLGNLRVDEIQRGATGQNGQHEEDARQDRDHL